MNIDDYALLFFVSLILLMWLVFNELTK